MGYSTRRGLGEFYDGIIQATYMRISFFSRVLFVG